MQSFENHQPVPSDFSFSFGLCYNPTMTEEKIVFIIPGFKHRPTNKAYKEIAKILKNEGYQPILITIPWKQATISENTEYFLQEYKKIKARQKYILGFSFGAIIAFNASTKVSTSGLILCSLSPYFKEDVSSSKLHCATLAKKIKAKKIHMLYGKKEAKSLIRRVSSAYRQISVAQKYIIPIKDTEHNIGDKRYLHTIAQIAKVLD